jgi:hypothetical protein
MKKISLLTSLSGILMSLFSCSLQPNELPMPSLKGGGDDDKPIIMHKVENESEEPLENAMIVMINNSDTLQSFTDSAGTSSMELPRYGPWWVSVSLAGYSPLQGQVNITDSFSIREVTLQR